MLAKNIIDVYGIDLVLFFGIDSTVKFHFRLILDLKYILERNFNGVKMILAIVIVLSLTRESKNINLILINIFFNIKVM